MAVKYICKAHGEMNPKAGGKCPQCGAVMQVVSI